MVATALRGRWAGPARLTHLFYNFKFLGIPTITPTEIEIYATKLLVIQASGILAPWKLIVAWELTSKSASETELYSLIQETKTAFKECGCRVHGLTSDMGYRNIQASFKLIIVNS